MRISVLFPGLIILVILLANESRSVGRSRAMKSLVSGTEFRAKAHTTGLTGTRAFLERVLHSSTGKVGRLIPFLILSFFMESASASPLNQQALPISVSQSLIFIVPFLSSNVINHLLT